MAVWWTWILYCGWHVAVTKKTVVIENEMRWKNQLVDRTDVDPNGGA
jgi:hypothetical protein